VNAVNVANASRSDSAKSDLNSAKSDVNVKCIFDQKCYKKECSYRHSVSFCESDTKCNKPSCALRHSTKPIKSSKSDAVSPSPQQDSSSASSAGRRSRAPSHSDDSQNAPSLLIRHASVHKSTLYAKGENNFKAIQKHERQWAKQFDCSIHMQYVKNSTEQDFTIVIMATQEATTKLTALINRIIQGSANDRGDGRTLVHIFVDASNMYLGALWTQDNQTNELKMDYSLKIDINQAIQLLEKEFVASSQQVEICTKCAVGSKRPNTKGAWPIWKQAKYITHELPLDEGKENGVDGMSMT
jgi:hypothetical protein